MNRLSFSQNRHACRRHRRSCAAGIVVPVDEVMPDSAKRAVFISHSSKDAELAKALCERLESQGAHCWIAPRDVELGRSYADECVRGIEESATFLLLGSESAISSVQVLSEVEQAHKRHKPIYTILIGKPQISKELDYYISRLHWIEYAGDSVDGLAERLGKVLSGHETWTEAASPPSLRRTVLYRRDAFMGSAIATVLVLACVGGAVAYWGYRKVATLDHDYRRLGYLVISPSLDDSGQLQAEVWVMAEGVPFADVSLIMSAHGSNRTNEQIDRSAMFVKEQVGTMELIHFPVANGTDRISTCLAMPNPNLEGRYRVTQTFAVRTSPLSVTETSQPTVSKEDGRPCGALSQ